MVWYIIAYGKFHAVKKVSLVNDTWFGTEVCLVSSTWFGTEVCLVNGAWYRSVSVKGTLFATSLIMINCVQFRSCLQPRLRCWRDENPLFCSEHNSCGAKWCNAVEVIYN